MKKLGGVTKGTLSNIGFDKQNNLSKEILLFLYFLTTIIIFAALLLRLFQLTIVKGNYYHTLADNNRTKELILEAKRGKITDRKGLAIAQNLDINIDLNQERIISRREYFYPQAIAHLIGYRQLADSQDLKDDNCLTKLRVGDKIGKKGIEKLFDCELRGKAGKKLIELTARGEYKKTLSIIPSQPGQTLQLAIDLELQNKTYELIKDKKTAVVAVRPNTGEILLFVSSPSFNPEDFESPNIKQITTYFQDKNKPLLNRITEGVYPPGSIFKLIVATGALEEKKITAQTLIEDKGILTAGPLTFGNWYYLQYGKTDGQVDVVKAIARSNDIFFYQVGNLLGEQKIKKWAEIFSYGKKTHLGLEEAEGTLPSSFWKKETLKENWYLGDTYNYSIGQGYTLVTPMQTVMVTAAIANNGYLCQPQFLKNETPKCRKLPIATTTLALIKEGMKRACSPGGTGWPLFEFSIKNANTSAALLPTLTQEKSTASASNQQANIKIQTACKTGTAESQSQDKNPHAWFTAYAPFDKPEIAITVLVENGGQGSDIAGPIVREILREYFEREN